MFGGAGDILDGNADDDELTSVDRIVNNDNIDGGAGTDTCISDPDPEVNCEED
jgi:hypothetical protein